MRRLLALALVAAVAGALALATAGGAQDSAQDGPTSGDYRVDAIFDTAKGIVPGQLVKVAGARVGEVSDVVLTPGYEARIQMSIDARFAPFRRDARCDIQPEGLISENFVQCDPGTPSAPALRSEGDEAPTVPLERTAVPINLTDLFEVWEVPVRDRLSIILTSLGAGVAARGEDLNEVLRRANPTLGLVRQAVATVDAQRDDLLATIGQAREVTRELAREPQRLQAFIEESADVVGRTGRRRAELREGLRRLPPLLAATRPALANLDRLARDGTPLARQLRTAAPDLDRLLAEVPGAARPALGALRALGETATTGRRAARSAGPVVKRLRTFSAAAVPTGDELEKTLVSLRDRGFVEGLLTFVYHTVAATARYDAVGHMLPAHVILNSCGFVSATTDPACDAKYAGATDNHARRRATGKRDRAAGDRPRPARPARPAPLLRPEPSAPAPKLPKLPDLSLPKIVKPVDDVVQGVLDALGGKRGDGKNPLGDLLRPKGGRDAGRAPADGLLDLLLGP